MYYDHAQLIRHIFSFLHIFCTRLRKYNLNVIDINIGAIKTHILQENIIVTLKLISLPLKFIINQFAPHTMPMACIGNMLQDY